MEALEKLVSELSPIANELNEKVDDLAEKTESINNEFEKAELVKEIFKQLNQACDVLKRLIEALSNHSGDGETFFDLINKCYGVGTVGVIEGEFETILNVESKRLGEIGLSEDVIDLVINQMQEIKEELLAGQPMEDANNILLLIETTQKRLCYIAEQGSDFISSSPIPYLRAAAGCVINVCVVTGDALTPFVVQDPTLKSYAIAIKSVYTGYHKLKEHGRKLLEGIQAFNRRMLRNRRTRNRQND